MATKKYVKFDCTKGYLDNKDDINYFATNQMRKIAFGKMLGDFDENGFYVINEKIVEELIKMPKVIVEVLDDADLIRSKIKADAFFHFILTIEDNKATLKLLEKMYYQSNRDFNSGSYNNINEYVLDEVIVPDRDFDRNALYQKYNISTDNDGEALSIFDMDELSIALYYNIIEKIKVDYLVQNALILKEKELESIEADYFEEVLKVITEYKDFGAKVKNDVKNELAEKHSFVIVSKPFFQKTVNEIVDNYIDFNIQELSPDQREEFLTKLRAIKENYYKKFKELLPIEIINKAGVRFDANQIIQESIIGGITQEIVTKGFTSSDVRKILINEDELKLNISKIKQMLKENEEICKRDNTKADEIVKDRKLTTEFYKSLEKENKVDILNPQTTLIKSTIEEKQVAKKQEEAKIEVETEIKQEKGLKSDKQDNKKKVKTSSIDNSRSAPSGVKSARDQKNQNSNSRNSTKQQTVKEQPRKTTNSSSLYDYGYDYDVVKSSKDSKNIKQGKEEKRTALLDELESDNRTTARQASSKRSTDEFTRAESIDLVK